MVEKKKERVLQKIVKMYTYKITGYSYDGDMFKFRFRHKRLISKEKFKHICEFCIIKATKCFIKDRENRHLFEKYPYAHNSSMDEQEFVRCMTRFGFYIFFEDIDVELMHNCFNDEDYGKELLEFEKQMTELEQKEMEYVYGKPDSS